MAFEPKQSVSRAPGNRGASSPLGLSTVGTIPAMGKESASKWGKALATGILFLVTVTAFPKAFPLRKRYAALCTLLGE